MFTKASERLYLAFYVKMNRSCKTWSGFSSRKEYQRNLRETQRSERRQAVFIAEYVQMKYFDIFCEAARYYNQLNTIYPTRPDLRKSLEYRTWKKNTNNQMVCQQTETTAQIYQNIDQAAPAEINSESESVRSDNEDNNNSESESVRSDNEDNNNSESESVHSDNEDNNNSESESEPEDNNNSESEPQRPEIIPHYEMRLEIPLINHRPKTTPTVTTETLETVVEEVIDQSMDEINLFDGLTTERIDQIIQELREDPELGNIFAEVEQEVAMDIGEEIDLDIRLENELLEW